MDDVDKMKRGALSEQFLINLHHERQRQNEIGHQEYNKQAFDLMHRAINSYGGDRGKL